MMATVNLDTGFLKSALTEGGLDSATAQFVRQVCVNAGIKEYDDGIEKTTEHMVVELAEWAAIGMKCAKDAQKEQPMI